MIEFSFNTVPQLSTLSEHTAVIAEKRSKLHLQQTLKYRIVSHPQLFRAHSKKPVLSVDFAEAFYYAPPVTMRPFITMRQHLTKYDIVMIKRVD